MATKRVPETEALRLGWDTMKKNIGFFIGILIIVGLIYVIPNNIQNRVRRIIPFISILIGIAAWCLQRIIDMGLIRVALRFCDNEKGKFDDLFNTFPLFFKYIIGSILYGLIVLGGLILLIIPGIILGIKFQFFGYFIVEKGLGPIEALKRSSAITKGVMFELFVFGILIFVINLLGVLALLIGLFATIPTTMVAYAYVYRELLKQTDGIQTMDSPQVSS